MISVIEVIGFIITNCRAACLILNKNTLKMNLINNKLINLLISMNWSYIIEWPWLFNSSFELKMDLKSLNSTHVLYQQLYKIVEHICFIEVSDCR